MIIFLGSGWVYKSINVMTRKNLNAIISLPRTSKYLLLRHPAGRLLVERFASLKKIQPKFRQIHKSCSLDGEFSDLCSGDHRLQSWDAHQVLCPNLGIFLTLRERICAAISCHTRFGELGAKHCQMIEVVNLTVCVPEMSALIMTWTKLRWDLQPWVVRCTE